MATITRKDLIEVAKLYYHGNCSQEQIAEMMGLSRSKISRMLTMARTLRIVEFKISDSPIQIDKMEHRLKESLRLDSVRIIPSNMDPHKSLLAAGNAVSEYLNDIFCENIKFGISWGTTMDIAVSQFKPVRKYSSATIVQLIGGTPCPTVCADSRELTMRLAEKLSASYAILQAPLYVSNEEIRDALLSETEILKHFQLFSHLDAALIGLGSTIPSKSAAYKAGYITLKESTALVESGFATDLCGNRIYKDGTFRPNFMSGRLIAISAKQLRAIPQVMAVAIGEDKAEPIIVGAKGGFFNSLITDEIAAIALIKNLDNAPQN
jgi:DNA-binding transcriptional regulator LsrR (DeoR family)